VRPDRPLADQFGQLEAGYERAQRALQKFYHGSTIPEKDQAKAAEIRPDFSAVVRPIFDLAAAAPKDPAVRDAMLWVVRQAHAGAHSLHVGEFALAAKGGLAVSAWRLRRVSLGYWFVRLPHAAGPEQPVR
jgi:hypothetical protein